MGTVQVDFQLPLRFNLSYIDSNGDKKVRILYPIFSCLSSNSTLIPSSESF